jgi:hypothetical protein
MKARTAWVFSQLDLPAPLKTDFMASGGSKAWVARLHVPAPVDSYMVAAEIEDTSARRWPAHLKPGTTNPVTGPKIWVGLRQHDVTGSQEFDWDYLMSLWPLMRSARNDWITTGPGLPTPHDRTAWRQIGSPRHLGYGFGHREAVKKGVCMFGARAQLPADLRLGQIVNELRATARLLLTMAAAKPTEMA